ncbi:MAG TPA: RHS repeat-associated core domain-containing protein [Candidatus Competibacter sp.]|nr:RHS repeat-associated core domain-containing protein [Candidatus Competibacter sp.]
MIHPSDATDLTDTPPVPNRPLRRRAGWMIGFWLCCLGWSLSHWAVAEVRLPNGEYIERHTDLSVKVLGGQVVLNRTWSNGRWYLNPAWAALRFVHDPLDGSVKAIDRAGSLYLRQGTLYVFDGVLDRQRFMEKTDDGWRWRDGFGNWITYDNAGQAIAYGDRDGVQVRFVLDAEGRRNEVRDHHDQLVFRFSYQNGRLVEARDRADRIVRYAYEGDRLTTVTDAGGAIWRYGYDGQGQLSSRTDPLGGEMKIFYAIPAPAGAFALDGDRARAAETETEVGQTGLPERDIKIARVGQITDEAGRVTTYQYAYDRLTRQYTITMLPPGGPTTVARYDREGRLLERTVGGERQRLLTRDGDRIESVTDARGLITRTEYNADRQPVAITTPDGLTVRYEYEAQYGQIARHTDELGIETRYRYDRTGHLIERIEAAGRPEQRTTTWTYDDFGQALSQTLGTGTDVATTRWSHDDFGNAVTQTDPLGQVTNTTYNVQGQALTGTMPDGTLWQAQYDALGRLTAVIDPLDHRTTHTYDALGRRTKTTDPTGAVTQYQYDPTGRLIVQTDALDQSTRFDHDTAGRLSTVTDPAGNVTRSTHDGLGRLATMTDPAGNVTRYQYGDADDGLEGLLAAVIYPTYRIEYRYDVRDRPVQTIQVLDADTQRITRVSHDGKGQVVSTTDPAGHTTLREYDGLGRMIRKIDALGGITRHQYDPRDNLVALTDANTQTHRFEYDLAGRKTQETRPLGGTTQYTYDTLGRLITRTDASGAVRRYEYDAAGRKTEETYALGSAAPTQTIQYDYDDAGRLTGYQQRGDTVSRATYTLDALGRPTEETLTYGTGASAITHTLGHGYTADGQRQALAYPGGKAVRFAYENGQLQTVSLPGGESIRWTTYKNTQPTQIVFPGIVRQIDYDPLQRPIQLHAQALGTGTADAPTGAVLLDWQYTYDATGNITQKDTQDGRYAYAYDALSRLTAATPPSTLQAGAANPNGLPLERYTYDAVHNRLSSAHQPGLWAYDADNRLTQYGQGDALTALSHTANGHLDTAQRITGQTRFTYDAGERLRRIDIDGQERARYQYDPFGRRIAKIVGGQTTWYLHAPEGLIAELDTTGHLIRAYGWQPNTAYGTAPLWQAEIVGTAWRPYVFQTDHLGTVQLATDAQGQIAWTARSEAFGQSTPESGNTITMNLRFPGQYYDEESGLHYNTFRDYDPQTGRYIESDPIGLEGGVNTYAYVEGNPLNFIDAEGLQAQGLAGLCGPYALVCVGGLTGAMMAAKPIGEAISNTVNTVKEICGCLEYKNTYDPGDNNRPKHGDVSYTRSTGDDVSPAPRNGQAALDNSVPSGKGRIGVDPTTGEIVIFQNHFTYEYPKCEKLWHGYVVLEGNLNSKQWSNAKKGGLPGFSKKQPPRGR